jgi:hypothetical protein
MSGIGSYVCDDLVVGQVAATFSCGLEFLHFFKYLIQQPPVGHALACPAVPRSGARRLSAGAVGMDF